MGLDDDAVPVLDHVQVAAPAGCEGQARRFYGALLGLDEVEKPEALRTRGGVWFALGGGAQLHVGVVSEGFVAALKAHPALRLPDAMVLAVDRIVATDADFGARQTLYAVSQDLPGDTFVGPRYGLYGRTQPTWRNWPATRATTAAALWELSEQLTDTKFPL